MRRPAAPIPAAPVHHLLLLALAGLAACEARPLSEGEQLARVHCTSCHAFPEPELLDRNSWEKSVLPQMAPRLGVNTGQSFEQVVRSPHMTVVAEAVRESDWRKIVEYYLDNAPDKLPEQRLPGEPVVDHPLFEASGFTDTLPAGAIISMLEIDQAGGRVFVGEGISSGLLTFDMQGRLRSAAQLASPATDIMVQEDHVLVLEAGLLHPNDEARGRLVRYDIVSPRGQLRFSSVILDSLLRPVFFERYDFDRDGREELVICEYGDNRGRLAIYRHDGSRYVRDVLDPRPGAIRFEIRDLSGDGQSDIIALFAQGDERIVLFENDGKGGFSSTPKVLARFPPVYGSMHFAMHDFNGDGRLDILYVNGDNFDFSRILKPYHGIRILENEGENGFRERFFFPIHGVARAEAADFDRDGDLDILTASTFPDSVAHPERGIMYFENLRGGAAGARASYDFASHSFGAAAGNQWIVISTGDLNGDGATDAIVGAMSLMNVAMARLSPGGASAPPQRRAVLKFLNRTPRAAAGRAP